MLRLAVGAAMLVIASTANAQSTSSAPRRPCCGPSPSYSPKEDSLIRKALSDTKRGAIKTQKPQTAAEKARVDSGMKVIFQKADSLMKSDSVRAAAKTRAPSD